MKNNIAIANFFVGKKYIKKERTMMKNIFQILIVLLTVITIVFSLIECGPKLPTVANIALNPVKGQVGTQVTITGSGFGTTQGTVTFNGTTATTINSWVDSKIVCSVPAGATTGNVVVTAGGVGSKGVLFTVTASITNLNPASGIVGSYVTINGSNFGSSRGGSTVAFNGTQSTAISSWSDNTIVCIVPAGATTGDVVVQAQGFKSNTVVFTVIQ